MKKHRDIDGFVEAFLTDQNGNKKKIYSGQNTFYADFNEALAKSLSQDYDANFLALDNLFSANGTPVTYGDGMIGLMDGSYQSFVTTISQPTANQFRLTGVYTNSSGSTVVVTYPGCGKSWNSLIAGTTVPPFVDFRIAMANLFPSTSVPTGEVLTVVWTITFTVH